MHGDVERKHIYLLKIKGLLLILVAPRARLCEGVKSLPNPCSRCLILCAVFLCNQNRFHQTNQLTNKHMF